jgi:hypothetical protein
MIMVLLSILEEVRSSILKELRSGGAWILFVFAMVVLKIVSGAEGGT